MTIHNNVNTEAMLAIADVIEYADRYRQAHIARLPGRHPDTVTPDQLWDCGQSTGCLIAWTNSWSDHRLYDYDHAKDELGLSNQQAYSLFSVDSFWWKLHANTSSPRAKVVAKFLRQIANDEVSV